MRAFASFLGLILLGLAAIAALGYPAWLLLHPYFDFPFHRIATRLGELVLVIGLGVFARRLGIANRTSLGYDLPLRTFLREMLKALALGAAVMLPVVAAMLVFGLREWNDGGPPDPAALARIALQGFLTGVVVALIEETLMRGVLFSAIARESGERLAIVLTALVYSASHFFARYHIAPEAVSWSSGLDLLSGTLHVFTDPVGIADAFLCLFAVGILLGAVRAATGNIAACIGLHAGWVWVITFVRETSHPNAAHPLHFLLSTFDGVVGWMILAWTAVIGFVLHRIYARRGAAFTLPRAGSAG
jgi:membrane protease YdiL (CAAX protease family)